MYEVTVHEYGITTPGASGWGRKRDDVWVNKDLHGQFPYWTRNKLVKRSDWMPPTVTVTRQPIHVAAAAYMIFHCRRSKSDTTTWQNYSVAYRVMKKLLEEGMPEKELKLMVDLFVSKRVTGNIKSSTTVPVWREFQSNAQSLYKQVQGNIRMRSTGAAVSIEDAKKLARWT
jgi:hypothetical protein